MPKAIVTKEEKAYNATRWCVSPRPQREAKTKAIAKKTWITINKKKKEQAATTKPAAAVDEPTSSSYAAPPSPIYDPDSPRTQQIALNAYHYYRSSLY